MAETYRSWSERRAIIRAIIADSNPPKLESFHLSPQEQAFFRARSEKAIDALARQTSAFKTYYALPAARPFAFVVLVSGLVVAAAAAAGTYIYLNTVGDPAYPIYAALLSLSIVAVGWAVAGWITHRNTIRQNTNSMLFARFSQAPFGEALHRFHQTFGNDVFPKITRDQLRELRSTGNEDDRKAATSVGYLLNYYEFIAAGVLHGDLDQNIIRNNIRGVICFYHDKCEPYIVYSNQQNPKVYEHLIKLRTHYREP